MKKLTYITLGLIGIMGTLLVGTVNAATTISNPYGSITYSLTGHEGTYNASFITIDDSETTITILDRDLGATEAGTGCLDVDMSGVQCAEGDSTYGYYFQWGNNYGFSFNEFPLSNERIEKLENPLPIDPGFSSNIFYDKFSNNWTDSIGVRGGSLDDGYGLLDSIENAEGRQGPCPQDFHVPSKGERNTLLNMLGSTDEEKVDKLHNELLIPYSSNIDSKGELFSDGLGYLNYVWLSTPNSPNGSFYLSTDSDGDLALAGSANRQEGNTIRCFYNQYAEYTESEELQNITITFIDIDGSVVISGSIEKGSKRRDGSAPIADIIEGYDFDYRYVDGTNSEFDFDTAFTEDTTLYAHRTFTAIVANGIYTGENGDITVIWNDDTWGHINLTLAGSNLDARYKRGFNYASDNSVRSGVDGLGTYIGEDDKMYGNTNNINNAWGGSGDTYANGLDNGNERYKRQGPCPTGYHVPSMGEWNTLIIAWCNIDENCKAKYSDDPEDPGNLKKIDMWSTDNKFVNIITTGLGTRFKTAFNISSNPFWSSSPSSSQTRGSSLYLDSSRVEHTVGNRSSNYFVRCFKNYVTVPTIFNVTFLNDGIEIASGSVKEGDKRIGTIPTPNEREGYRFDYWYADGTNSEFDFSIPIEEDTILHAHRTLTARIPNGIYTGLNENGDITVVRNDDTWGHINLTLAGSSLNGNYYWGWNEPSNNNWSSNPTNGAEHNNDWGGGGDTLENGFDDGNERYKRQGPCPDGYHIPSRGELNALAIAWCNIEESCNARYTDTQIDGIAGDFRKPDNWTEENKLIWMNKAGLGITFRATFNMGSDTDYRSSSPNSDKDTHAYSLYVPNYRVAPTGNGYRNYQFRIRCFRNYVVAPEINEIAEINISGPKSVTDGDNRLNDWIIYTTDSDYTTGAYLPVEWNGTAWVDATHESVPAGYTVGFKVTLNPENGYIFAENPTINYNSVAWTNSGHTTFDSKNSIVYIDLGEITASTPQQSGGHSGGGGHHQGGTNENDKVNEHFAAESQDDNTDTDSPGNPEEGQEYSDEFQQAYEFAYKNGITTMNTIDKADMEGPLTRIAMAKMLSKYAINILGKKPANIVVPNFRDINDKLDEEYDYGVELAYQLGIMGINMPKNRFRPFDLVTRGEFATALSRMLFGTPDGEYEGTDIYYTNHLKKLINKKIITNNNPRLQELRGYVMIMLMRSTDKE